MDQDVVISVYQGVCREGDFSANLATVREVVAEARRRGSHFLAFPETFLSGYESREAVERGARAADDPELLAFVAESAGHDLVILVGLARRFGTGLANAVLVIHRGRVIGAYHKVMLTDGDRRDLGFVPGTDVPVFHAHGVRFAVVICHDTSFPHVALAARLQGAQVLFTPHYNAIGPDAVDDHRRWVRNCHIGLACQLKMVVARANIVRADRPGHVSYGDSIILSPQGEPLAEARLFRTELLTARVEPRHFRGPVVWGDAAEVPAWLKTEIAHLLTQFRPSPPAETDEWLRNMIGDHGFAAAEVSAATGLTLAEVQAAAARLGLAFGAPWPPPAVSASLRVRPYPGGRHPRLGFLEGAVAPQRETKASVFAPWPDGGYVVVDLPEAVFCNLGLVYLAHTHVPTVWTAAGIELPRLEWDRHPDGSLELQRRLPNGIVIGARVVPAVGAVAMDLWLRNGTAETLTGIRAQVCVMLSAAPGFAAPAATDKLLAPPYAAARSADGHRWVLTGWEPCGRAWGNPPVPCIHADPVLPDCRPGETVRARGRLWFYEGTEVEAELRRVESTGWRTAPCR